MKVTFDPARWVDKSQTAAAISDHNVCTIDARAPGVYSGEADMHDGRKGHIGNSVNLQCETITGSRPGGGS